MGEFSSASQIRHHHEHLQRDLADLVGAVRNAAALGDGDLGMERDRLVTFLRDHLVPHAEAEETSIYDQGSQRPELAVLVTAMREEHLRIRGLIGRIDSATSPTDIVLAVGGFHELISAHFHKENENLVPALHDAGLLDA